MGVQGLLWTKNRPLTFGKLTLDRELQRLLVAVLLSATTTFAIAWLMQSLIQPKFGVLEEPLPTMPISFVRPVEEPKAPNRTRKLPPLPAVQKPPVVPKFVGPANGFAELTLKDFGRILPTLKLRPGLANGEVMSLVQARPVYPEGAKRRGTEGFVVVEFAVRASGKVDDLRILEAQPADIFDRAALAAVSRSRYRPRVVDGEAVDTIGLRTRLTFNMD